MKIDKVKLLIIIIIAVLLRAAVAFYLGDYVVDMPGTFDQISYDMLARRVVGGYGFTVAQNWWPLTPAGAPTAHWSYLYTLYLAGVYALFGFHPLIARLIQAALGGILMPWLLYRLGKAHFSNKVGLIAAGLSAVYLYFIYYAAALMTETFYIIGILWILDVATRLGTDPPKEVPFPSTYSFKASLNLGPAMAVTVLFRQVILLFFPVLFLWLFWRSLRRKKSAAFKMIGVLSGATLILIAAILPWTWRNYQVFNRFVLLNTNAGYAFFWGNHPIHGYNFISILPADGPSYQDLIPPELRSLDEAALDQALLKRGLAFIQADPLRYLILSGSRIKDYFKFWPAGKSSLVSNISRVFSFALLLPFMIYGLIIGLPGVIKSKTLLLYLFIITYTGVHLLTWALIRYRLPVDALLIIFAGVALQKIQQTLSKRFTQLSFPTLF